jgi:hypothetical protein
MNSYLLDELLKSCRKNPDEITYDSREKICVAAEGLTYQNRTSEGGETLRMPPSHAKEAWKRRQVTIVRGGASNNFKIGGLMAYCPWTIDESSAGGDPRDEFWVRVRMVKPIGLGIEGLRLEDVWSDDGFFCSGDF